MLDHCSINREGYSAYLRGVTSNPTSDAGIMTMTHLGGFWIMTMSTANYTLEMYVRTSCPSTHAWYSSRLVFHNLGVQVRTALKQRCPQPIFIVFVTNWVMTSVGFPAPSDVPFPSPRSVTTCLINRFCLLPLSARCARLLLCPGKQRFGSTSPSCAVSSLWTAPGWVMRSLCSYHVQV